MTHRIAGQLNSRVSVFAPVQRVNDLGEQTVDYEKIGAVWAAINVTRSAEQSDNGNTTSVEITHRIQLRRNAVPELNREMYFAYAGNRYDIVYVQPYYRDRGLIECMCRLVVET